LKTFPDAEKLSDGKNVGPANDAKKPTSKTSKPVEPKVKPAIPSDNLGAKTKSDSSVVVCSGCHREVPRINIELHKLRCNKSSLLNEVGSKKSKQV